MVSLAKQQKRRYIVKPDFHQRVLDHIDRVAEKSDHVRMAKDYMKVLNTIFNGDIPKDKNFHKLVDLAIERVNLYKNGYNLLMTTDSDID